MITCTEPSIYGFVTQDTMIAIDWESEQIKKNWFILIFHLTFTYKLFETILSILTKNVSAILYALKKKQRLAGIQNCFWEDWNKKDD